MLYTFMNKNYKLFDFEYDSKINAITKIINLYDKERLPENLYSLNEDELLNSFNTWLNQRYSRNSEWFKKQQWNYDFMKLTSNLVVKSYGLSLSDQYWIKPSNDNKAWEDVNFFTNKFNFYSFVTNLKREYDYGSVDVLYSPDITTGGEVDKAWLINNDGTRVLYKSSNTFLGLEPINECIASKICEILEIPHANYDIKIISNLDKKTMVSECATFINEDTELIPAYQLVKHSKNTEDEYNDYIKLLENNGIENVKDKVNKMLLLDVIMANCDRHLNNYGVIRDVNTLKWLDVAPIYDTGRSLATSYPTINSYDESIILFTYKCKRSDAFKFIKNITLTKEQKSKLKDIPKIYENKLLEYLKYTNIEDNRKVNDIVDLLDKNIKQVLELLD